MTTADSTSALTSIKILLAEANSVESDRIRSNVGQAFRHQIQVVENHADLLIGIAQELPQVLLLGKIDKFNYLDICKDCHQIRQNLPIYLISREKRISDSLRHLAVTRGLTDIVEADPAKLTKLFESIVQSIPNNLDRNQPLRSISSFSDVLPVRDQSEELPIMGQTMLNWLEKIVVVSNNYFGPLAQGHYWRKAHTQIMNESPFIASWSVDHFGKITCQEHILHRELTDADIQCLRTWVQMFVNECARIIVDFELILTDSDLSILAKTLLIKP